MIRKFTSLILTLHLLTRYLLYVIFLNIKQSKTDQFRKGVKVVIGQTNNDLCPVSTLLSYLSHWATSQAHCFAGTTGPLFPKLQCKFVNYTRLTPLRANLPVDKYASHSFQIGTAITATSVGIEDPTIQT